jgi:signal transduction histidine kinase
VQATGLGQERLPPESETTLYRITQEALTNIAKHANAGRVSVIVTRDNDWVSLIIEDDGVGFDVARLTSDHGRPWGLIGMRERATLIGGSLDIESTRDAGTSVAARIPCPREPHSERRHA